MFKKFILIWVIVFSLLFNVNLSYSQNYDKSTLLVKFKSNITNKNKKELINSLGGILLKKSDSKKFESIRINKNNIDDIYKKLKNNSHVEFIQYNYKYEVALIPNDQNFAQLYHHNNTGQTGGTTDADMDTVEAWNISTGSSDVVIGVIDTGIDYTHLDLQGNIWTNPLEIPNNNIDDDNNGYIDDIHGINAITGNGDPSDDHFHGTSCAGIIGAKGDNEIQIVGINWNVQLIGMKFLDSTGSGYTSDAIECINYAISLKNRGVDIRVLSNSWSGDSYDQFLVDAIEDAGDAGILFVVAAGNSSRNIDVYPAYPASYSSANIISVCSTDHIDALSSFSNFGAISVDLGAPGTNILCIFPHDVLSLLSGTSMATPQVAGAIGLILAKNNTLNISEIKPYILNYGDTLLSLDNKCITKKRLNVYNSINAVPDPEPSFRLVVTDQIESIEKGNTAYFQIDTESILEYSNDIKFSINSNLPLDAEIIFDPNIVVPGGSISMSIETNNFTIPGNYLLSITGFSGDISKEIVVSLEIYPKYLSTFEYSNSTSINIPDNDPNGIVSSINVDGDYTIWDLGCEVNITHPTIGQLVVLLVSPNGTVSYLHNHTGTSTSNIYKTYYPNDFRNESTKGNWSLIVSDNGSNYTGTLDDWSLILTISPKNRYAIILDGGNWTGENYIHNERYYNESKEMFKCLKNSYGFINDDIYVLISDGTDPDEELLLKDSNSYISAPLDLDGDLTDDIEFAATKYNLGQVVDDISLRIKPQDLLYIYITGRGYYDNGLDTSISMYEESMTDDQFADYISLIDCNNIIIVMQQDYSEGFIDDLNNSGRVLIASTSINEEVIPRTKNLNDPRSEYDEFSYHWISGLNQKTLGDTDPNEVTNFNFSDIPIYSDSNNDDIVSISEAFNVVSRNDIWIDQNIYHSKYISNPANLGSEISLGSAPIIISPNALDFCFMQVIDRIMFILGTNDDDIVDLVLADGILNWKDQTCDITKFDHIHIYCFDGNDQIFIPNLIIDKLYTNNGSDYLLNYGSISYANMDLGNDSVINNGIINYLFQGPGMDSLTNNGTIIKYIDPIVGSGYEYSTIQAAINASSTGANIQVMPGIYTETITLYGKAITVRSIDPLDPEIVATTIIDGEGMRRGVVLNNAEGSSTIVSGFTIRNCYVNGRGAGVRMGSNTSARLSYCDIYNCEAPMGAGVSCYNANGVISYCKIHDNYAPTYGGGLSYETTQAGTITQCDIYNNKSPKGGGIYILNSNANISICTIRDNHAIGGTGDGGGIHCSSTSYIKKCKIQNNIANRWGGGVYCYDAAIPTLINSIIIHNIAINGGGLYCSHTAHPTIKTCTFNGNLSTQYGNTFYTESSITTLFTNCILWDTISGIYIYVYPGKPNPIITYSDIWGGYTGTGNINSNPLFINQINWDYHLSNISPCIDIALNGITSEDLEGIARPINGICDMGAYEYHI